jgi:hypothetical protein
VSEPAVQRVTRLMAKYLGTTDRKFACRLGRIIHSQATIKGQALCLCGHADRSGSKAQPEADPPLAEIGLVLVA